MSYISYTLPTAAFSNLQIIVNNALKAYERRTKIDLLVHPLAAQLQDCDSPSTILDVLQKGLDQSRRGDERWTRWLHPMVNVLFAFSGSGTLGTGVGLVSSLTNVVFAAVVVLFSAAKDVRESQPLFNIFERIELFLGRLEMYTELPPTTEMADLVTAVMVEVLTILGIATMEIKGGRLKKYTMELIGRTKVGYTLTRLDMLTRNEALMATTQNLSATPIADESARGVTNTAIDIRVDDRVADIDDRAVVIDDVNQVKQNQLQEKFHKWLSSPDPSTNHNIACGIRYKKIANWFVQGNIFQEWKSTGSFLWIHGESGSGKTVLCSTVIQDIEAMCKAGDASMAYFYFDFRDYNKQSFHDLVSSLLNQLSARSGSRCAILSDLYSAHDLGKRQPSDNILAECLKRMLTLPDERPTYLIIDALDESPNTPIPSPRETVLQLLKELVKLSLPNLRMCVTSRPKFHIRNVLESLTSCQVSLYDQIGQNLDIADYVRSVVYSDSEQIMRRWRMEDKELVIETLSKRVNSTFRLAFGQLETLRHCPPPSVKHTLDELPESLDETYERVLKKIKKANRDHAYRLLQCLVVAIRPLEVKELVEVLAADFHDAEGIPKLKPDWRWEDEGQALLASCSDLIIAIGAEDSRVVQLSHLSVREFLTSPRLATSSGNVSRYHIVLEPAHRILAQACLRILFRLDNPIEHSNVEKHSPLVGYAAKHWVRHAQFENAASYIIKEMGYLFNLDKPYFAAWCQLHDIDTYPSDPSVFFQFTPISKSRADTPLYYAALCGFRDLAELLVVKDPQHVDAIGGYYMTPVVAALAGKHFQLAQLLLRNGSSVDPRGHFNRTPLHSAAYYGDLEMVQELIKYGVDVNAQDDFGSTPLDFASWGHFDNPRVVQLLLDHGADPNVQAQHGLTPLYLASHYGGVEIVRLLAGQGANVEVEDEQGRTPSDVASGKQRDEIITLLSKHRAK